MNKLCFPFAEIQYDIKTHLNTSGSHSFKSLRSGGRLHAGVDIYTPVGYKVHSMQDGVVLNIYHFYRGSFAVEILNEDKTILRYCEILPFIDLQEGKLIKAGTPIGQVSKLKGIKKTMLHLEYYSGLQKGNLTNRQNPPFMRRSDLLNPTELLLKALESI